MTTSPLWQTMIFATAALAMIAVNLLFQPDLTFQVLMLAPAVAILGLPHGALDLPIAQSLWSLQGWRSNACFAGLYIGLALILVCFWIVFPGPTLCAFLIYSAVHFSGDWDDAGSALRWTGGVAAVGAPALFGQEDVATIFSYLAPQGAADFAAQFLAFSGAAALIFCITLVIFRPVFRTRAAVELGIIWIAAACLAPLVYFIVYFCALHSVRHFTNALASLDRKRHALGSVALLCVVTVLAGCLAFMVMQRAGSDFLAPSILKIVFIGLAALTVPHMILVDRFQFQSKRQVEG
jgi:Brp/Blh family beta-carotene 15,15'-monooxygenase